MTRANITWLNITQFLGAMNDNILKLLIIFSLIHLQGTDNAGIITAAVGAAFVLPFLLFSASAGCIADRFSKSRITVAVKIVEVAVTLTAVIALYLQNSSLMYAVVFLMAVHSAFFTPAKYGMIPELVETGELSRANGLIESFTFLAIIIGSALAPFLAQFFGLRIWAASLVTLAIAIVGFFSALRIPGTPPADPAARITYFPMTIWRTISSLRNDGYLMLAIIGMAYFMFIGAFAQLNLIGYGIEHLSLTQEQSGYLFLAAAFGIGIGTLLAAKLCGRDIEFGIVPLGAFGLTVVPVALMLIPPVLPLIVLLIVLFGISAGLLSLPLQTFIQFRAEPARRGEVIAASSFINWVAILIASGITYLFSGIMGMTAAHGFSIIGYSTLGLTILSLWVLPDFFLRFIGLVITRTFYRIRIIGAENVPVDGPALLIPNHVTWMDALLLIATSQRRIRFVMARSIYNTFVLRGLFRIMHVIPVSSADGKRGLVEFIKTARAELDQGFMVCIFAEGAITRTGMLAEFRGGFERIVKGTEYPIIPVYIGGAWGSIFSYAHGKLLSRLPLFIPYPVTILFGKPMTAASTTADVRQAVMELSCDYFASRKPKRRSLGEHFILAARENWRRKAIADTTGRLFTYGKALAAALALRKKLNGLIGQKPHVGVLLPPSCGGVFTNIALTLSNRIPVNLNYTAASAALNSAIEQCGIETVITSRAFLEKMPSLKVPKGAVYLEDVLPTISKLDKLMGLLKGRFLPVRFIYDRSGFHGDKVATVIFSSGSTGEPKGVMLTHHNIMSNVESLRMVFKADLNDNICATLPFFHSLGFTGTIWFPLVSGFSATYHPNPMDGEAIARLVRENRSTLLLATPTFLLTYLRRAKKEDFASLRLVITGAEKLKPRVADAFEERFGIRPLEGYGATELSPVIALSVPDAAIDGVHQPGSKDGSVGHPLPGVAIRVVDPETGEQLKSGNSGLILVKGPNVMLGYLGKPDKTAEVIRDGWYVTGDIGVIDEDGFMHITDRLSRFSKIGGEMVPHGAVEDALHGRLGESHVLAVTSLPDEKRGEKLVVLFTKGATTADSLHAIMTELPLPNLWKPGRNCYVEIENLPMLGSGKLDLKRLKEMAGVLITPE